MASDSTVRDEIRIERMAVDCIIGILPHEREKPQRVWLDILLKLNLEDAARSESVEQTVDYAKLASALRLSLETKKFQLLETACRELCAITLAMVPTTGATNSQAEVSVTLRKPEALPGEAIPSVTVTRRLADRDK